MLKFKCIPIIMILHVTIIREEATEVEIEETRRIVEKQKEKAEDERKTDRTLLVFDIYIINIYMKWS